MYDYNREKYGACYWLDPEFPTDNEVFGSSPKGLEDFTKRPNPFILFDDETVDHCLARGVQPLRSVGIGGSHTYESHDSVTLYLAKCKLKAREFYKIGLTTQVNPINRDSKTYSEIARAHRIPARGSSLPSLHERFTLWKCTEHEFKDQDVFDPAVFKDFAGKTEVVHSNDPHVVFVFDQAFDQLSDCLKEHSEDLAWLEAILLTCLVKALYDERYVNAKAALARHCSGVDFYEVGGVRPSCLIPNLSVGLPSKDVILLEDYAKAKLVPLIEAAWAALDIEDPVKRFARGKSNYQAWWGRRGGRTNYWNPRYYGLTT